MLSKICKFLLFCLLLVMLMFSCAKNDPIVAAFIQALTVEIIAGPADGGSVLNNAPFSFEWRVLGGDGNASFTVQLSGVDAQPVSTAETSKSYSGQIAGSYTFTVTASTSSETSSDTRTFSVGVNVSPPQVVITGPRGSSSSDGSGVIPAYAPGMAAFFSWTGDDGDRFGEVVGYRWRSADTEPFTEFTLGTTAGFEVSATPGTYTITVEAEDNMGGVSTTTLDYEVKEPTILIVDDKPQADPVDEIAEDGFYTDLFEGFAFAGWDVAENGEPTAADLVDFEVVVVYSTGSSDIWKGIGTNYPEAAVPLADYVDGGGKIWVMGQGILEDIGDGHENPPDATEFEAAYLHMAVATGDSATDAGLVWKRAGDFDGDLKFSFADNVLGDPDNFPRITMNVQSGDVEHIVAGDGAEIIYEGKGGLGDEIGDVALRFPSGGTATQVVFMTFPLFEDAGVKASLVNSRALTQEIMREMGQ